MSRLDRFSKAMLGLGDFVGAPAKPGAGRPFSVVVKAGGRVVCGLSDTLVDTKGVGCDWQLVHVINRCIVKDVD